MIVSDVVWLTVGLCGLWYAARVIRNGLCSRPRRPRGPRPSTCPRGWTKLTPSEFIRNDGRASMNKDIHGVWWVSTGGEHQACPWGTSFSYALELIALLETASEERKP